MQHNNVAESQKHAIPGHAFSLLYRHVTGKEPEESGQWTGIRIKTGPPRGRYAAERLYDVPLLLPRTQVDSSLQTGFYTFRNRIDHQGCFLFCYGIRWCKHDLHERNQPKVAQMPLSPILTPPMLVVKTATLRFMHSSHTSAAVGILLGKSSLLRLSLTNSRLQKRPRPLRNASSDWSSNLQK